MAQQLGHGARREAVLAAHARAVDHVVRAGGHAEIGQELADGARAAAPAAVPATFGAEQLHQALGIEVLAVLVGDADRVEQAAVIRRHPLPHRTGQALHRPQPPQDLDPLLRQSADHRHAEVPHRVGHGDPDLERPGTAADGAGDDQPVLAALDREVVVTPRARGDGADGDLEDVDRRHRLDAHQAALLARPDAHQHAVVVERERRDRRLVPAGELLARPIGVDLERFEQPVVEIEIAGDAPHAARRELPRPAAERAEGIAVEGAARDVRVAAADDPEVAVQHALLHRPAHHQPGLVEVAGAERVERRRGGEQLGVRGDGARVVGVVGVRGLAAADLDHVHPHGRGLAHRAAHLEPDGLLQRRGAGRRHAHRRRRLGRAGGRRRRAMAGPVRARRRRAGGRGPQRSAAEQQGGQDPP